MMRILVTGATGYIGGRLVPALVKAGHEVRAASRSGDPGTWWADQVENVACDALDRDQVLAACADMDAVFYLIHAMGGDDFMAADREAALYMRDAVDAQGVGRVVYLSGLVPEVADDELSDHIASRLEVESILSEAAATVISIRAAVIVGSGSTSFEIVRQISERMPVEAVPSWMDSKVQPISVVDMLDALQGALTVPGPSRSYDVGGSDQMSYADLLRTYADVVGREKVQLEVPIAPTALVGALVGLITDVPSSTVRALVESLHHDMVCQETDFRQALLPAGHQLIGTREAIERSLAESDVPPGFRDPLSAMPHDPRWAGGGMGFLEKAKQVASEILPGG